MKHTPEPWELRKMHGTEMWGAKSHISDWFVFEFALEKDAARIVACVNACAGMDDPAAEIERLRAERGELLAALENLIAWANIKDGSPSQQLRDDAMTAIAKAKGVTP